MHITYGYEIIPQPSIHQARGDNQVRCPVSGGRLCPGQEYLLVCMRSPRRRGGTRSQHQQTRYSGGCCQIRDDNVARSPLEVIAYSHKSPRCSWIGRGAESHADNRPQGKGTRSYATCRTMGMAVTDESQIMRDMDSEQRRGCHLPCCPEFRCCPCTHQYAILVSVPSRDTPNTQNPP